MVQSVYIYTISVAKWSLFAQYYVLDTSIGSIIEITVRNKPQVLPNGSFDQL